MKYDVIDLGPRVKGNSVTFKMLLPNLDPEARVLIIGSFCDWKSENSIALRYDSKSELWKGTIEDLPDGMYEYAVLVKTGSWYSNPATDPYARMTGKNGYSAFTIPAEKPARLDTFRKPRLEELVAYELDLDNFNYNFEGVRNRVVYYLSHLGINAVMFSPWVGYDPEMSGERIPVHYYAPDYSYGSPYELKVLINECHKAGIAVIMDIDLHAVSPAFGINQMYPLFENKPMLGKMDDSAKQILFNYSDEFTREFAFGVCKWWLDEFNVDGFRFLNSGSYWDNENGEGLYKLTQRLYESRKGEGDEIFLFAKHAGAKDAEILNKSYTNGMTNRTFLRQTHRMAENRSLDIDFWKTLDLNQLGYHEETTINKDKISNTVLNSIEDSETQNLIVKMGVITGQRDALGYQVGDRKNHWWKLKPYIIAQFAASGIPVIFNGQEIGNNRFLPDKAPDRFLSQQIPWHYLNDFAGRDLYRFHQKLILLRSRFKSIRSNNFLHYFTDPEHQVIVFKRYLDNESVIIAINFSNESHQVLIPFPIDGIWHEYLDDYDIKVEERNALIKVPARYGVIFYQK